ncbi:MAG: zf-HC2 domain-containing protein [Terracidiphilus sp.]
MNGCNEVRSGLTEYLDSRLTGRAMQEIDAHLQDCRDCAREWESMRQSQASLAELGPAPEPPDLPLRIRVAVSQERARGPPQYLYCLGTGVEEHCGTVPVAGWCGISPARSCSWEPTSSCW